MRLRLKIKLWGLFLFRVDGTNQLPVLVNRYSIIISCAQNVDDLSVYSFRLGRQWLHEI